MKRVTIICCAALFVLMTTSCAWQMKTFRSNFTYKDPETMGGYWDITTQTGQTFNHVKCTYWGTDDDTATFITDDGMIIIQSGAVTCTRSK